MPKTTHKAGILPWGRKPERQQKINLSHAASAALNTVGGDVRKVNEGIIRKAAEARGVPVELLMQELRKKGAQI